MLKAEPQEPCDAARLVRGFRQAAGLTQNQLASRAGLSVGVLRDLEQGRTSHPSAATLAALVAALGPTGVQAEDLAQAVACRDLWLRVLGPLAVWRGGTRLSVGGPGQRAVLGLLALSPGSLVHRGEIIDVLWPDRPPANAAQMVLAHVSRLRKTLVAGELALVSSVGTSCRLRAGPGQLDLLRFGALTAQARAADARGDYATACRRYEQALDLWQGDPVADVELLRGHPAVTGLVREHAELVTGYAHAASAMSWHDRVLPLLRQLTGREPLNELAHARLMIALGGCGHQAEALAVFRALCRRLGDELGVSPGLDLARAHRLVLRQEIPRRPAAVMLTVARSDAEGTPVPRQVPAGTPRFAGRAGALTALSRLLDDTRETVIAAVGGAAGVGKTALAVRWAREVAGRFPDGQLYADLRGWGPSAGPVRPADVISRFLRTLGVTAAQMPAGPGARLDLYRSVLARKRMLIVLDNARDATQVRPLLPGGPCVVLITSRSSLTSLVAVEAAVALPLDVMTAAEAHELLALRLGPGRVAAEPEVAAELVELCARLPLALAIAAARAARNPAMPLAALAAGLRDTTGRFAALDAGDGAGIEAEFSWSYRRLPGRSRRMFRLLGVHPGPDISAAAAASLAGTSPAGARATLIRLADASLLTEHLPGRYRFHDLLRDYAAGRARAEDGAIGVDEAIHRTADHYVHSAHAAGRRLRTFPTAMTLEPPRPGVTPEQFGDFQQAMAWFGAEQHVLTALARAVSAGPDSLGRQAVALLGELRHPDAERLPDKLAHSGR